MTIEKVILQTKTDGATFGGADGYTDVITTGGRIDDTERIEYYTGDVKGVREVVKIVCNWLSTMNTSIGTITHANFRGSTYELVEFSRPNNRKITFTLARVV